MAVQLVRMPGGVHAETQVGSMQRDDLLKS
jgi:hypothetical protein